MLPKWRTTFTVFVIMMALSACSLTGTATDNSQSAIETESSLQQPPIDSGWIKRGEAAVWPEYIPDDIPVLEGKIRLIMEAPGSHIRIFYEDLTKGQLDQYLRLLEQQGFHLEYQVYVQEGFPDNSEERLKKGDYDAVDITRGDYHMNIGYGEGDIAYDIDTTGFAEAIPTSAGLDWPADLVNMVPKPERCPIEAAFPDSSGGYQIVCQPADDNVKDDYFQALQSAGYIPRESSIVSPDGVYGQGDLDITVAQHSTASMLITIYRVDVSKKMWPPELTGIIPPPQGCLIHNVLVLDGLRFSISCKGENDRVAPDYINLLISEGFTETKRIETQSGEPFWVGLEKGTIRVDLLISSPREFSIDISEKP